jgi:hypothetical protein
MENHNWTQPNNKFSGDPQQIYQNPNAPFINTLVDGSAFAVINGSKVHISSQVAYAFELAASSMYFCGAPGSGLILPPPF